jgi:hypothetical protein
MEDLSFLLKLCLHVRVSLEGGEALRVSLFRFAEMKDSFLYLKFKRWLTHFDQSGGESCAETFFSNHHVQIFLEILTQGLEGHSIYERVKAMEEEFIEVCKDEFQRELDKLPYVLMIPLLLFMFPAYMLLLLGPILNLFLKQL